MARSKTSKRSGQRDFPNQSLDRLLTAPLRPPPVLLPVPVMPAAVVEVGDRRLWQPDRSTRPPHAVRPGASRVVAGARPEALRFADPQLVAICVRRQVRREVLFALRKTRKGSGARRRKNFWSAISC